MPRSVSATLDHMVLLVRSFAHNLPHDEALLPVLGFEKFAAQLLRNRQSFNVQLLQPASGSPTSSI